MRAFALCGGFLTLVTALGCGGSGKSPYSSTTVTVSGRILTPGGEPIRGGAEVVLTPKAKEGGIFGKEGAAIVGADGSFKLKTTDGAEGIPGGFYVVVVRPYGAQNDATKQAATRTVPKKYWDESTSDMTAEITEAKTNWDLKLAK